MNPPLAYIAIANRPQQFRGKYAGIAAGIQLLAYLILIILLIVETRRK